MDLIAKKDFVIGVKLRIEVQSSYERNWKDNKILNNERRKFTMKNQTTTTFVSEYDKYV